jgi:hypothetical protein
MALVPTSRKEHIGIELECVVSKEIYEELSGYDGLNGIRNKYKKYNSFLEIGTDASIKTKEVGLEFRILTTPENIYKHLLIVKTILKKLKAAVNKTCGLHVHLDMRQKDPNEAFANLVENQYLWEPVVRKDRWVNNYCKRAQSMSFGAALKQDRYTSVNACSYPEHQTIEVRVHQGTTNILKIIKWVNLLRACSISTEVEFTEAYKKEVV